MINSWIKVISFISILIAALFIIVHTNVVSLVQNGDVEVIETTLNGSFLYQLLFSLLAMIIQNSFTIIPLILLISINVALFGFFYGFIWSWVTSIIAALIVFVVVRYFFQDWLIRKVNENLLAKAEQKGFWYVFEARIFPFVPTSLVNVVSGISPIRLKKFIVATMIGNFIYFFVLSLIPFGLFALNLDKYVILTIIILSVLSFLGYKFFHSSKNKERKTPVDKSI